MTKSLSQKLLTLLLNLALLLALTLPALAAEAPAGAAPLAAKACVMVPLRPVADELGFPVAWNNVEITLTGSERYITMTVGRNEYFAAPTEEGLLGASLFPLTLPPCEVDGTTYVPLEVFNLLLGEDKISLDTNAITLLK